jgi:pimeloyl-ACP methyl ester carboxylesterase
VPVVRPSVRLGVVLLALVGTLAACTSDDPTPAAIPSSSTALSAPPADLEPYYSQTLTWTDCGDTFQCSTVTVPRNWAEPTAGDLQVAVIKLPASKPKERIGSLLVNPGGPGVSGVEYARAARTQITAPVREAYDIIGFDPRGTGATDPVKCLSDDKLGAYFAADPTPDDDAEQRQLLASIDDLTKGCEQESGAILPYVSTEDTARDMDVIRASLGDERLSYLGASYGTYLGAVYAGLFPERVGRLVLDGALDPTLDAVATGKGQLQGFQQAFDSFVADCAKHKDCPLPADPVAAGQRVAELYKQVDATPLPTFDAARPLTEGLASLGIGEALYAPEYFWEPLRNGLKQAFSGDGSTLLQLADLYTDRKDDGSYSNLLEANVAINCLDKGSLKTVEEAKALVPEYEKLSPVFGAGFAWGSISCRDWPYPPVASNAPITADGAAPIVVIGTTRDPATPYAWAQSLASQLSSGVLLTFDGDGHTGYNRGSACINRAVESYLVAGTVPKANTTCG